MMETQIGFTTEVALLNLTDEQLLAQALAGDEDAFTVLYRRRQGPVFRFALHMSGSSQVAEEVTQDVFVFLLQRGRDFDPSRGALGAYLFGVARNYVRRALERNYSEAMLHSPADDEAAVADDRGRSRGRHCTASDFDRALEGRALVARTLSRGGGALRFAGVELCAGGRSSGMCHRHHSFAPAPGARHAGEETATLGGRCAAGVSRVTARCAS